MDELEELIDSLLTDPSPSYASLKKILEKIEAEDSKEPTYEEYLKTYEEEHDRFFTAYPHGMDEEASES